MKRYIKYTTCYSLSEFQIFSLKKENKKWQIPLYIIISNPTNQTRLADNSWTDLCVHTSVHPAPCASVVPSNSPHRTETTAATAVRVRLNGPVGGRGSGPPELVRGLRTYGGSMDLCACDVQRPDVIRANRDSKKERKKTDGTASTS